MKSLMSKIHFSCLSLCFMTCKTKFVQYLRPKHGNLTHSLCSISAQLQSFKSFFFYFHLCWLHGWDLNLMTHVHPETTEYAVFEQIFLKIASHFISRKEKFFVFFSPHQAGGTDKSRGAEPAPGQGFLWSHYKFYRQTATIKMFILFLFHSTFGQKSFFILCLSLSCLSD